MTTIIGMAPAVEHYLPGHPESPNRMSAIALALDKSSVLSDLTPVAPVAATEEQLLAVHRHQMVELVQSVSALGGGRLDADTYGTKLSYELAKIAAGTTSRCLELIASGQATNGIALIRPPGHHAESERVGGFCLFNNVAVAIEHCRSTLGIERVLVVDYDVHHGNGTQEIFYEDSGVMFISMHLYHHFFYPGTGAAGEIGAGPGKMITMNVPFGPGAGDTTYSQAIESLIWPKAIEFGPEIVVVSAGFDAHWIDPLASASLSLTGYARMSRELVLLAEQLCQGRLLFVLEGGYHPDALSNGVLNTIYGLLSQDKIVDPLGQAPEDEPDSSLLLSYLRELHLLN